MTIGKRIRATRESLKLTQQDVATKVGVAVQTIYKYENEIVTNIPIDKLERIAKALQTTPAYLMGWENRTVELNETNLKKFNIRQIKTKKIPLLGEIACGKPIFCNEEYETFIEANSNIKADFCLIAKGDSMINARIFDGDVVFVREQPTVENGEIAVIIIGDEATLKRVYVKPDKIILRPENPTYNDIIYEKEEINTIKILGKAVAFMSLVR